MYVSFTPRLSHPGSRDLCTSWNALCIPVYWRAHVRDLQLHSARTTGLSCSCLPWRLSTKTGRCMRKQMVYTDSAYWDSGAVATQQFANALVWIKNNRWAYCTQCCFVTFTCISTKVRHWLNLLHCLHVICGCRTVQHRLTVWRHHWHWLPM